MLESENWVDSLTHSTPNTMAPVVQQYPWYLWNKAIVSSTRITFDRLILTYVSSVFVFCCMSDTCCCTRNCCGSARPFNINLMDPLGAQVMRIEAPCRCDTCWCPCCLRVRPQLNSIQFNSIQLHLSIIQSMCTYVHT